MAQLSVVIISKNEAANIGRCLASVAELADDVVLIDSFSTDGTQAIARSMGARVFERAFDTFMGQKNFGIEKALFPLVLSLDADEAPDAELQNSILKAKRDGPFDGYRMDMLTNYAGHWIYHSGWHPDPKLRLFDIRKGRWRGKNPHEKFEFDDPATAKIGHLKGNLLHYSYPTVESHYRKAEAYSEMGARFLAASGRRVGRWQLILNPAAKFFKEFIWLRGFLDGRAGLTIARISAWSTYLKYKKALDLQRGKSEP